MIRVLRRRVKHVIYIGQSTTYFCAIMVHNVCEINKSDKKPYVLYIYMHVDGILSTERLQNPESEISTFSKAVEGQ